MKAKAHGATWWRGLAHTRALRAQACPRKQFAGGCWALRSTNPATLRALRERNRPQMVESTVARVDWTHVDKGGT